MTDQDLDSHLKELEKFYRDVLQMNFDLTGVTLPQKPGFQEYMVVPEELKGKEDLVFDLGTTWAKVNKYSHLSPIASSVDRKKDQKRPSGLYAFSHRGGDEPDKEHLGKSYDDAMAEKMFFLNPLEYLLCVFFHKWKYNDWMDDKGWTRTSSLWSDGSLVCKVFFPDLRLLFLGFCYCDSRNIVTGPRELFLGEFTL